jgi:sulfur carrier protein
MNIVLNGERREFSAGSSVEAILTALKLHPQAVVVEVNRDIIDRETYSTRLLAEGDQVEVIRFVGGG